MKRYRLIFILFISIFITGITDSSYAKLSTSLGGYFDYSYNVLHSETSYDTFIQITGKRTISNNRLGLGLFFDVTYARIGLGFSGIAGDTSDKISGSIGSFNGSMNGDIDGDVTASFLNIYLLGKYPFNFNTVRLWPALGLGYDINLVLKKNGGNIHDAAISDLFLLIGFGADFKVGARIFITPTMLFGCNLTPEYTTADISNTSYSGWKFNMSLGAGYYF